MQRSTARAALKGPVRRSTARASVERSTGRAALDGPPARAV
ncbi:hypothetical protein [Streptomyces levis]